MRRIESSAYELAQRFVGLREIPGSEHNPQILAMLRLDMDWPDGDEVPWCSGFVNYCFWLLDLDRSRSLRARSWLEVGEPIGLHAAEPGFDVVVLSRGPNPQPGPDVIEAPGHVGLYARHTSERVSLLSGNQSDTVNITAYDVDRVLGVRRIT